MKKYLIISIIFAALLLVIGYVSLAYVFLWSGVYINNHSLSREENRNIKSLVLTDIKKIYKEHKEGKYFFVINRNFMNSAIKIDENEYKIVVATYWPNDWTFEYMIQVKDGEFIIADLGIDP